MRNDRMVLHAHAKINLAIDVISRRSDGYHKVVMVMQDLELHDVITLETITTNSDITINSDGFGVPKDKRNLVWQAATLLQVLSACDKGVHIHLKKRIPVSAGLAGGSSDAAAVLRGLNVLWDIGYPTAELMKIGLKIGADVPYCIIGGTCLAEGIGEQLTVLPPLPRFYVLLAKPPKGVSTRAIYNKLALEEIKARPDIKGLIAAIETSCPSLIGKKMGNVLQEVSEGFEPRIAPLQKIMKESGATGSIMTGSGPTVFGLFRNQSSSGTARNEINKIYPDIKTIITGTRNNQTGED